MDYSNVTAEQLEIALRLCDILSIEDITVACAVLSSLNWDLQVQYLRLQRALDEMQLGSLPPLPKPQPVYEQSLQYNDDEYEYELAQSRQTLLAQKKAMFEQAYTHDITFNRARSERLESQELHKLKFDRSLLESSSPHRQEYLRTLMQKSEEICIAMLQNAHIPSSCKYEPSSKKTLMNQRFVEMLYKRYQGRLNFTFGTFLLNLIRSYLDDKLLLVYIHSNKVDSNSNMQRLVSNILRQPQIARFTQKNCICYGMFDSSDDYEIVQQYVPLKDLPGFALFRLDCKLRKEYFMGSFLLGQTYEVNFLEWLARAANIPLKRKSIVESPKKEIPCETPQLKSTPSASRQSMYDIKEEQDRAYLDMVEWYKLKKQQSFDRREEQKQLQEGLECARKKYLESPEPSIDTVVVQVKFRMPVSGTSVLQRFLPKDTVGRLFAYVHCFCRKQFEDEWAQFDLTQTFPSRSLMDLKEKSIQEVFGESQRENLIIKEL